MKEKILIVCKYEKWCINWFNRLLKYLAYNVFSNDKALIVVNKRHRCLCIPEKEIAFTSEAMSKTKQLSYHPTKVIEWDGDDINMLWNLI